MKKSKKKQPTQNDSMAAICFGIILMLLAIVFIYLFKNGFFHNEKHKEELKNKILAKQVRIANLRNELNEKKQLQDSFKNEALRFYKLFKIAFVVCVLGIGFICFAIFSFGIIGTIGAIVSTATVIYQVVTIVFQNKVGNFNTTLMLIEQYFIDRTFRKNAFEPAIIAILEEQLNDEQKELEFLKLEYNAIQ